MRKRDVQQCATVRGVAVWAAALSVLIAAAGLLSCSIDSPYTEVISDKVTQDGYSGIRGILDESFGGGAGYVTHHNAAGGEAFDYGYSVCLDSSGRILVCGASDSANEDDMTLWRYLADGTLDESFGSGGVVTHHNAAGGDGFDKGSSVCLDGSGRIIVCGYSMRSSFEHDLDMVLWRYLDDGTLDGSLGNGGVVVHHNAAGGDGSDLGQSMWVDNMGRIVVCGRSSNGNDNDMTLWRFLGNGNPDLNFGNSGVVTHHNAAGGDRHDYGNTVCVDGEGRILVSGHSEKSITDADMVLWRYMDDGTLDESFGSDGIVTHHGAAGGDGCDYVNSMYIDSEGRILVCGFSDNGTDYDMTLWRYRSDGSLDESFGGDGVICLHGAEEGVWHDSKAESLSCDDTGRILVCGSSDDGEDRDMALWRFFEDGTLDKSFGDTVVGESGTGVVTHHNAAGGDGNDRAYSMCLDDNGRIITCGSSSNSNDVDMALWRYQ